MYTYGDLAVHNNVAFEANTAGVYGGAVSLPFDRSSHLSLLLFFMGMIYEGWFDLLRQLTEPRRKDSCWSSNRAGRLVAARRCACTLHPAPYTLHPATHTLHPPPHTLHSTPFIRCCVVCVKTPKSRTQVCMFGGGVGEVHTHVVFQANTAAESGGAVSLPFSLSSSNTALLV